MPFPESFAIDSYSAWHKVSFPGDDPLPTKIDALRKELAANSQDQLTALAQVLTYATNYCRNEYQQEKRNPTDYHFSLSDALGAGTGSAAYDLLFKSADSIINKLWRKNRGAPVVHLGNIREHLTDLVRTDISATTLDSAAFLARRFNAFPGIIYESKVRNAFDSLIGAIDFAPEMKMESGYFAYHGLVRFKSGLTVEVQIYSELMRQWRRLSHHLYERARVEGRQKHEFNSKESRLISLGHLLHLAECQLQQLGQEFGGT
jgi:ppGpp synthetase/RelA/SpoT-type nucleotidyltranferase